MACATRCELTCSRHRLGPPAFPSGRPGLREPPGYPESRGQLSWLVIRSPEPSQLNVPMMSITAPTYRVLPWARHPPRCLAPCIHLILTLTP